LLSAVTETRSAPSMLLTNSFPAKNFKRKLHKQTTEPIPLTASQSTPKTMSPKNETKSNDHLRTNSGFHSLESNLTFHKNKRRSCSLSEKPSFIEIISEKKSDEKEKKNTNNNNNNNNNSVSPLNGKDISFDESIDTVSTRIDSSSDDDTTTNIIETRDRNSSTSSSRRHTASDISNNNHNNNNNSGDQFHSEDSGGLKKFKIPLGKKKSSNNSSNHDQNTSPRNDGEKESSLRLSKINKSKNNHFQKSSSQEAVNNAVHDADNKRKSAGQLVPIISLTTITDQEV
jgi:hypothetical protein